MAKEFAKKFYSSITWQQVRDSYIKSQGYLCEIHRAAGDVVPAEIVHHKVELTPENINDDRIALGYDNLQAVCRDCHAAIHSGKRFIVTTGGGIAPLELE